MVTQFRLLLLPLLYKKSYFTIGQSTNTFGSYTNKKFYNQYFKMHDEYVEINTIPTRILTFGKWIDEPFQDKKELILIITGNPGLPGFYTTFASSLFNHFDKKLPIWIIGHAGHDEPPDKCGKPKVPRVKGNEDIFLLQGQVKHKTEFIEKYIPDDVKVHLIGHSVGAWTILQLLKNPKIKARIHHSYMLFPTIERMKESSAGQGFEERLKSWQGSMILTVFGVMGYLPHGVRSSIVGRFIKKWNLPEAYLEEALKGLKTSALERMVQMGVDQVQNVYDLDVETITANVSRMTFYYGTRDHWVPTSYYDELLTRIPNIDAHLDTHDMAHAFNIRNSLPMADIMSGWIANRRPHHATDSKVDFIDSKQPLETHIENMKVTVQ